LIGLEAFRVILRDERLRDVLLIFETPDYFRGNRQAGSKRGQLIAHLENERHAAEESLVRKIVTLTDEEWYQEQASHTLWEKYKKKKVSCEGKIYKLLAKENGAMFENLHNRRAGSISRASKVRAMKSERAKKLVEANGEWVPTIARAPRHLEVEPAKDLGSLLLRSGKRCE
jgi:hypothetical protein